MLPAKSPYLTEVMRIILKELPYKYGKKVLILASKRFFKEAAEYVNVCNEEWGIYTADTPVNFLRLRGMVVVAAPWLTDYEFEIRPPA